MKLAIFTEYPGHDYWLCFMLDKVLGPAIGAFAQYYKTALIFRCYVVFAESAHASSLYNYEFS
jgi:hypothetical protein